MAFLGLFGWESKVRRLRKRWDRLREHALKKHGPLKSRLLQRLDSISSNLTTLEEQNLSRIDRARISKGVEIDLEEIREMMKLRGEEPLRADVRKQ